jgi:SAM-dependent methyltransferase
VDRSQISHLAHADHPIAAPLSDASVELLLRQALTGRARVLDLGCGDGTWLLRALQLHPGLTATGVDLSDHGFAATRAHATQAGVADRLLLQCADAREYAPTERFDAVLCVGAAHAFGGLEPTLAAAARHLADGGVLLVGDGFWERTPSQAVLDLLDASPDDYGDLASTVERVQALGWVPLHGHVSSLPEWDAYEWAWTGALARWALDHPDDPDFDQVLAVADEHRSQWLNGYRGTLGFVTLLLRRG